uniref:porin family protein n=1 Tax=Echinicola arenosa TaxID=2774144 RepID=UPI001CDD3C42|nr:porin family protein [Echinicola arenosa]
MNIIIKASFIFLLVIASTALIQAQTSIGIRGGLSYSGMSYRPIPSIPNQKVHGVKSQPVFGLALEHYYKDHAGIELDIQYVTTGYIEYNEEETLSNETQFDYLKIPLLSNFYFGRSGRFHIKMGPHFGRLMKATDVRREFETNNPDVPILPTYGQEDDDPNRFMYGLTAGAGISKVFGKSTIVAEVRASYEFGRPESQDRIFDMSGSNLEFTVSYLFQVLERK